MSAPAIDHDHVENPSGMVGSQHVKVHVRLLHHGQIGDAVRIHRPCPFDIVLDGHHLLRPAGPENARVATTELENPSPAQIE